MGHGRKQLPEAPTGARRQWAADRALRAPMRSPGRPEPSRAVQREFWRLIATGITTVEASAGVGVSWPVGARWLQDSRGCSVQAILSELSPGDIPLALRKWEPLVPLKPAGPTWPTGTSTPCP